MSLLNTELVDKILKDDKFASSHHAKEGFLGAGMLYYALAYMSRVDLCVCLGSGSGFVPKLMRQAQRDAVVAGSCTVLVDADLGELGWGKPDYHEVVTAFRKQYPDVIILKEKTEDACASFKDESIGFLHIDADHSYDGVKADYELYAPKMKRKGIISLHDSIVRDCGVFRLVDELREKNEVDVVNLSIGTGLALVRVKRV